MYRGRGCTTLFTTVTCGLEQLFENLAVRMVEIVSGIPLVDFSAMSIEHESHPNASEEAVKALARKMYEAFSTVGFVYLRNHGIPQEQVTATWSCLDLFFVVR